MRLLSILLACCAAVLVTVGASFASEPHQRPAVAEGDVTIADTFVIYGDRGGDPSWHTIYYGDLPAASLPDCEWGFTYDADTSECVLTIHDTPRTEPSTPHAIRVVTSCGYTESIPLPFCPPESP